jgi:hypothetical protein
MIMNWERRVLPLTFVVMILISSIVSFSVGKPEVSRQHKREQIEKKAPNAKAKTIRYRRKVVQLDTTQLHVEQTVRMAGRVS